MSTLQVLAVWDDKAKAFNRPYFVPATGLGIRAFIDEVNRQAQDNIMYQHPEDFNLTLLGEWNEENGTFTSDKNQQILMRGRDAKKDET